MWGILREGCVNRSSDEVRVMVMVVQGQFGEGIMGAGLNRNGRSGIEMICVIYADVLETRAIANC
jgi:hypothetical protein